LDNKTEKNKTDVQKVVRETNAGATVGRVSQRKKKRRKKRGTRGVQKGHENEQPKGGGHGRKGQGLFRGGNRRGPGVKGGSQTRE